MGQIIRELLADWSEGVNNTVEPDAVPKSAYIRARNCALRSISAGRAVVMKRKGMTTLNSTAITGATAVIGIYEFRRRSGSAFTHHHLVVSDNGRLDKIDPDTGALTAISASAFTSSIAQEYLPSFTTANNMAFIVNGSNAKKYDGTTLYQIGIDAPGTAPTLTDDGTAGNPDGTYEGRVTFYNSVTGQESSAGPTSSTVTVATNKIAWASIPTSADPQVDTVRLYVRNTATQSNFYLAAEIAEGTTSTTTNNTDASLTEIGPDTDENDPPPSGVKFACFHKSRLFLADTTNVYYSKLDMVESFDPEAFETPNPSDGQAITGLISIFDLLLIFKTNSVYVLVGDDPDTWAIRPIDNTIGCSTFRSIVPTEGRLYWWSEQGPVMWAGGLEKPELLGDQFIADTISPDNLSFDADDLAKVTGARDITEDRILWAVPQLNQTRNTLILPFNHRISRWESDGWDPMDAACLATIDNAAGQPFVVLGNYAGQLFHMGNADNDGVETGTTMSGTFVASGTSMTTITDAGATFSTTGAGLKERKVTVVDSETEEEVDFASIRHRITSNTATTFTLHTAVGNLVDGQTYKYYIGGPAFDWETAWYHQEDPFSKKRYQFVYTHFRAGGSLSNLKIHFYYNYDINPDTSTLHTVTTSFDVELWDEVDWDTAIWSGGSDEVQMRFRVGRTGTAILVRMRHFLPDAELTILKLGIMAEMLSERIG
jgi:hypothetical protein